MSESHSGASLKSAEFLEAARVPHNLKPQQFAGWQIDRLSLPDCCKSGMLWQDYTILRRAIYPEIDYSNMHRADDNGRILDVVMEDSPRELRRHLPIWLHAKGRVLITGLGLGCVVRGLLGSPQVQHIDVIEIDPLILQVGGKEFEGNKRVTLHHGDALEMAFPAEKQWDYAWHDIWTPGNIGLQEQHVKLMMKFDKQSHHQGAWAFPRDMKKVAIRKGFPIIGAARAA